MEGQEGHTDRESLGLLFPENENSVTDTRLTAFFRDNLGKPAAERSKQTGF